MKKYKIKLIIVFSFFILPKTLVLADEAYNIPVIYLEMPVLAKNYKKCIAGTSEFMKLSDQEIYNCQSDFYPQIEQTTHIDNQLLIKNIDEITGIKRFFLSGSPGIYVVKTEKNSLYDIYLWSSTPEWSPLPISTNSPKENGILEIQFSIVNKKNNTIKTIPVLKYEYVYKDSSYEILGIKYMKDFDLMRSKKNELILVIYKYTDQSGKNNKRLEAKRYQIILPK